ncbi:hypothetical protein JXA12_03235 [Candidatus Woesearchaeota archaeon]|nr:hypothetical protein [Candidatus Woesearchaeota archaeon]
MKKTIILMAILLLALQSAAAEVVIFDLYETDMTYEDGKLLVTKQLRLKNTGTNPIIPGEIHFKISQEYKDSSVAAAITDFEVVNKYDKRLDSRQVVTDKETDLIFTVWDPLLPNFYYDMTMTYALEFDPKGVLFYQVILPEERTTIPIRSAATTFNLPKRYHITYFSPDGDVEAGKEVNSVSWDVKGAYHVEYSVVPFPRLGFKAVNAFWVLIILLFLLNLFFRMKKKARTARYS